MLITLNETIDLINSGKLLHIAADEKLLKELPKGNWIGGTTPYFMGEDGGIITDNKLFVNEFESISKYNVVVYNSETIHNIGVDAYENGFTILILPFGSEIVETYAKDAPGIEQIFMKNIAGWVSGFNLAHDGEMAKVVNGSDLEIYHDMAIALHIELPENQLASIGIINIFEPDTNSPIIEFSSDAFEANNCFVDGEEVKFADYIKENDIDTKLPIISNYSGSNINVSIKEIVDGTVKFYAPVFKDTKYMFAKKVTNYAKEFEKNIINDEKVVTYFSCNCILNFLYGELEGKSTAPFVGPVTFGEVAYQLVNQTLVYIYIQ